MIKVVDGEKSDLYNNNKSLIDQFFKFSAENLKFNKPVDVRFLHDEGNAEDPLGKTAFYNPDEMSISIYVTGRHIKDILRSISHELIHHVQNCRGDLDNTTDTEEGYAQRDDHMRDMEHQAYTSGNIMNFRDFEDNYKKRGIAMLEELKKSRLKRLHGLLVEEFEIERAKTVIGEPPYNVPSKRMPLEREIQRLNKMGIDQVRRAKAAGIEQTLWKDFIDSFINIQNRIKSALKSVKTHEKVPELYADLRNEITRMSDILDDKLTAPVDDLPAAPASAKAKAAPAAPSRRKKRRIKCKEGRVEKLQKLLKKAGFNPGASDDKFGTDTQAAIDALRKHPKHKGSAPARNPRGVCRSIENLIDYLLMVRRHPGARPDKAKGAPPAPAAPDARASRRAERENTIALVKRYPKGAQGVKDGKVWAPDRCRFDDRFQRTGRSLALACTETHVCVKDDGTPVSYWSPNGRCQSPK